MEVADAGLVDNPIKAREAADFLKKGGCGNSIPLCFYLCLIFNCIAGGTKKVSSIKSLN